MKEQIKKYEKIISKSKDENLIKHLKEKINVLKGNKTVLK